MYIVLLLPKGKSREIISKKPIFFFNPQIPFKLGDSANSVSFHATVNGQWLLISQRWLISHLQHGGGHHPPLGVLLSTSGGR